MKPVVRFFSSLELTVACLCLSMVLIFFGTLAQVQLGIKGATEVYFYSLFVYHPIESLGISIPYMPGGYLIGAVLLANLVTALFTRFRFTAKKLGALSLHLGVILLIIGEFVSSVFQEDYRMILDEGSSADFIESYYETELVIIDPSDPQSDRVYAIPEKMLEREQLVEIDPLPFALTINTYMPNSELLSRQGGMTATGELANQGHGTKVFALPIPETGRTDERNIAAAVVTLFDAREKQANGAPKILGTWLAREFMSPQSIEYDGKSYKLQMRRKREYLGYTIHLEDFSHDKYLGTNIPKNFSSDVIIDNPATKEKREFRIFMNNPLRYDGLTFYQASFANDDKTSILQVVRNPGRLIPYISCTIISLGMLAHFLISLVRFVNKRSNKSA